MSLLTDIIKNQHATIESLRQQLALAESSERIAHNTFAMQMTRADKLEQQRDHSRREVVMLRGHLASILKNAKTRGAYWTECMADQALNAEVPKE